MSDKRRPGRKPDQVDLEIAQVVEALRAPATPEELRNQDQYLEAFDAVGPAPGRTPEPLEHDDRKALRTIRIGAPVAAAAAVVLVAAVSAAAAYTGNLPRGLQSSAHRYLGAQAPPAVTSSAGPASSPTTGVSATAGPSSAGASRGPVATGSSGPSSGLTASTAPTPATPAGVRGLCTAWSKGGLATTSPSYARLAAAAGGSDRVLVVLRRRAGGDAGEHDHEHRHHDRRPCGAPGPGGGARVRTRRTASSRASRRARRLRTGEEGARRRAARAAPATPPGPARRGVTLAGAVSFTRHDSRDHGWRPATRTEFAHEREQRASSP